MSGASSQGSVVLYVAPDGGVRVEVALQDGTLWLTQTQMAELFQVSVPTINAHLKGIFQEREVSEEATVRKLRRVGTEGKRAVSREVALYALPAILAVGYRVRGVRGTHFRQWSTQVLEQYLRKGFAMDDARLKQPRGQDAPDYFDELLERIRDIRASEKRMYTRVRDILALAADYQPSDADTQRFFQLVQNKLHHAVTGMTAPELVMARVDAHAANMGLTTWAGDRVKRADASVAKNYLREDEIRELNRLVVMFLDYAEDQASRRKQVFLQDWRKKLDDFLRFTERPVLVGAGTVTREAAEKKADEQFVLFEQRRREAAEAAGEEDAFRALEEAAKALEPSGKERKP